MKRALIGILMLFAVVSGSGMAQGVIHEERVTYGMTIFDPPLIVKNEVFKAGLSIMDCHNMIFEDCEIIGELELNDSYPETGLRNIAFKKCYIHDSTTDRLIMMGGSAISEILFENCKILRCIGGTHVIYFSGGHWKPEYPPIGEITLKGCEIGISPAGRHVVQFNGRFIKVKVIGCTIYHGQLCGLSLIGVQDAVIKNNVFYGSNRGAIVIYDYASHWGPYYNWFETQADIDSFLSTHQPNQNIDVTRNTIIQGPRQFSVDPWHSDDPTDGHGAVTINNAVHSGFTMYVDGEYVNKQFDFPSKNLRVFDNIIWTPNKRIMAIEHPYEATQTEFTGNLVYRPYPGIPFVDHYTSLKAKTGNFLKDPEFKSLPKYGFIDLGEDPNYDWSKYETSFDPWSAPGYHKKVGKTFKVYQAGK